MSLQDVELDEKSFMGLLEKAIGQSKFVQNQPPVKIPEEGRIAKIVTDFLAPYSEEKGGPLKVELHEYVKGRPNVILTYTSDKAKDTDKVVSFVGSHMDVVAANPEDWKRDPFKLVVEGDKLYGRGVTDCLGHVCLLTTVFKQLAETKPQLDFKVVAVFIANEEASETLGVGIDELEKQGKIAHLKHGPLFWVDSADFGPTMATGGVMGWQLDIQGRKFHSGVPQLAINPIELAGEVIKYIQDRFYKDVTKHADKEKEYNYAVPSTFKPTQIGCPAGSLNQIPQSVTVKGDIRFTPFYTVPFIKETVQGYIDDLKVTDLDQRGPSKYDLPDLDIHAKVTLKWLGHPAQGVACKLDSPGYKALHAAITKVRGEAKPFSLTGSLPVIRDLQEAGFDVQCVGFGRMEAYHATDEFGLLSEFKQGAQIVFNVLAGMKK